MTVGASSRRVDTTGLRDPCEEVLCLGSASIPAIAGLAGLVLLGQQLDAAELPGIEPSMAASIGAVATMRSRGR
jgi:threonine/homoserine efflux transporter RhtA